jgi:uncharacterized RDD family membrane protein YckC
MLDYPIDTPENVRFHYTIAGPGTRLAAWLLDMVLVSIALLVLALVLGVIAALVGDLATALLTISAFVLVSGYWILLEAFAGGRTIGKRALGLRVVAERGLRLTFGQVVLRNLIRFVDMLPGPAGVAALFMLFGKEHRRLGDLVAGTLVIRERRVPPPERIRGLAGERRGRGPALKFPGDLVRKVPPQERDLLLDLCMRRDALDDGVRHRLFTEVASHYRPLLALDQDDGISDEKLILLMTAEIFERLGVT